jgi:tripartite-type tricarboxylate transporter receptor subunit TctC
LAQEPREQLIARTMKIVAAVLALAWSAASAASAEDADFAGKTITIYIGNPAGGTYDLVGRLVARHLGAHLPGHPTVIAENMPGAGSLRAAAYLYNVAPKDGTALGIVTETLAVEQALDNPAVQFDAAKFTWIGRVVASNAVHIMWYTSKVHSIDDAKRYEATVAGTGAGNVSEVVPALLNAVIGTRFKVVRGYQAANETMLAMERGEVEGAGVNWTMVKATRAQLLRDNKIIVILQDLPAREHDLPDVPALGELGQSLEAKQLLGLYANTGAIGRAFFAPPGLPPATAAALRNGFIAMTKDPEFVGDAKKISADELNVGSGEQVLAAVERTLNVPQSVLKRAREIFGR